MTLSFDEAISNHHKMLVWISQETRKQKRCVTERDYFIHIGIEDYDEVPCNDSYLCQYAFSQRGGCCAFCPVVWGNCEAQKTCRSGFSCLEKWRLTVEFKNWEAAADFAMDIANRDINYPRF